MLGPSDARAVPRSLWPLPDPLTELLLAPVDEVDLPAVAGVCRQFRRLVAPRQAAAVAARPRPATPPLPEPSAAAQLAWQLGLEAHWRRGVVRLDRHHETSAGINTFDLGLGDGRSLFSPTPETLAIVGRNYGVGGPGAEVTLRAPSRALRVAAGGAFAVAEHKSALSLVSLAAPLAARYVPLPGLVSTVMGRGGCLYALDERALWRMRLAECWAAAAADEAPAARELVAHLSVGPWQLLAGTRGPLAVGGAGLLVCGAEGQPLRPTRLPWAPGCAVARLGAAALLPDGAHLVAWAEVARLSPPRTCNALVLICVDRCRVVRVLTTVAPSALQPSWHTALGQDTSAPSVSASGSHVTLEGSAPLCFLPGPARGAAVRRQPGAAPRLPLGRGQPPPAALRRAVAAAHVGLRRLVLAPPTRPLPARQQRACQRHLTRLWQQALPRVGAAAVPLLVGAAGWPPLGPRQLGRLAGALLAAACGAAAAPGDGLPGGALPALLEALQAALLAVRGAPAHAAALAWWLVPPADLAAAAVPDWLALRPAQVSALAPPEVAPGHPQLAEALRDSLLVYATEPPTLPGEPGP